MQREPGFVPKMPAPPELVRYWARPRGTRKWEIVEYLEGDESLGEPEEWYSLGSETPIVDFADWYELGPRITPPEEK